MKENFSIGTEVEDVNLISMIWNKLSRIILAGNETVPIFFIISTVSDSQGRFSLVGEGR
jgi:hypothetical protein